MFSFYHSGEQKIDCVIHFAALKVRFKIFRSVEKNKWTFPNIWTFGQKKNIADKIEKSETRKISKKKEMLEANIFNISLM